MTGNILNSILTKEQQSFGLWLSEAPADADCLNLILHGSCYGTFNAKTPVHILVPEIRHMADEIMSLVEVR